MRKSIVHKLALTFATAVLLTACSHAPAGTGIPVATSAAGHVTPSFVAKDKIKHVVFIIQENRTFDNIFGGPNPFPGADAALTGQTADGRTINLSQVNIESSSSISSLGDPNNYHPNWLLACNAGAAGPPAIPFPVGRPSPCLMNGFNLNALTQAGAKPPPGVDEKTIYSYVNRSESQPYWDIAKAYALGDRFFMGHNSESFTAHQYLFSGQSNNVVDSPVYPSAVDCNTSITNLHFCAYVPWGCDSPPKTSTFSIDASGIESASPTGAFPCFGQTSPYRSIADLADAKGVTWTLYAKSMCSSIIGLDVNYVIRHSSAWVPNQPDWKTCYDKYGPYKNDNINLPHWRTPSTAFFQDENPSRSNTKRQLSAVTWILPLAFTSDHPGVPGGYCGPGWVAGLLNTIGASKDWDSTVVFILWDDWGGFYDHVPPYVVRDQQGPGFRVPLLVVSPYARRGVIHTNVEFATLLKFTEDVFGLGRLGGAATDTSPYVNNLNDFFDFNAAPNKYTPISETYTTRCKNYLPSNVKASVRSRWLKLVGGDPD